MSASANKSIVDRLRNAGVLGRVMADLLSLPKPPRGGETIRCVNPAHADRHPSFVIAKNLAGASCKSCGYGGGLLELTVLRWGHATARQAAQALEQRYLAPGRQSAAKRSTKKTQAGKAYPPRAGYWDDVRARMSGPEGAAFCTAVGVPHAAAIAAKAGLDVGGEGRPRSMVLEVVGPNHEARARKFRYAPGQLHKGRKSDTWSVKDGVPASGLLNLHRLPTKRDKPVEVWIVAGEKDLLNAQGRLDDAVAAVVALSPALGEGQHLAEFADTLSDCNVVVIYDADDSGRSYAEKSCFVLGETARSIKDVVLPFTDEDRAKFGRAHPDLKGPKDLTDWFELGHTLQELRAVVDATPKFVVPDVDLIDEPVWVEEIWRSVGERSASTGGSWFTSPPPQRQYLLSVSTDDGVKGVLPRGKVGMLVSGGGKGKTWFLTLLAISVATGVAFLEEYQVPAAGAVLLALAEEDVDEVRRRLYHAVHMLRLHPEQMALLERNLFVLPLCGRDVAFQDDDSEVVLGETPLVRAARRRLERAGLSWNLLVFDPLARFAGVEVESDNAAATRFVQILETFVRVPGNPTVLTAHHANKMSRLGDTNETASRGSSALTDAVRWQANLDTTPKPSNPLVPIPGFVTFRIVKSNYGAIIEPELLVRDPAHDGGLRLPTRTEREKFEQMAQREAGDGPAANRRKFVD